MAPGQTEGGALICHLKGSGRGLMISGGEGGVSGLPESLIRCLSHLHGLEIPLILILILISYSVVLFCFYSLFYSLKNFDTKSMLLLY